MSSLLISLILLAAEPQFEAHTLDGKTAGGSLLELQTDRLTIQTADGPVSLQTDTLRELSQKGPPAAPDGRAEVRVDLVDGSSLVARQYTSAGGRAGVTLGDGQVLQLPTASVAAVRLQPQSQAVAAEWSRIMSIDADGDLLVVRKGDWIDYHQGVLQDVGEEIVRFNLDGDTLPVKRSKVHGLIYRHAAEDAMPEAVCRLRDLDGSRWSVHGLNLDGDLQWTTPCGVKVTRPLASVARVDFSRDKIVYLGDLRPESVKFTPYFQPQTELPAIGEFFAPRVDTNLKSEPLRLDGKQYDKGLALHSRTEMVFRLPGRFRRLKAVAGIDDGAGPRGHVRLTVHGDEKLLLETTLGGVQPAQPLDLDLTGVRRVKILVDFGEEFDSGDHLDLCNARIIK